jgi:hypothetical protein
MTMALANMQIVISRLLRSLRITASSPEIWSTTISGSEEVLAGKWGGLFLGGYLLRKKFIGSREAA